MAKSHYIRNSTKKHRPIELRVMYRLRLFRTLRRWTMKQLSENTAQMTSNCHVSYIETGYRHPSLQTIELLAKTLNVPFHLFFTDDLYTNPDFISFLESCEQEFTLKQ